MEELGDEDVAHADLLGDVVEGLAALGLGLEQAGDHGRLPLYARQAGERRGERASVLCFSARRRGKGGEGGRSVVIEADEGGGRGVACCQRRWERRIG